MVEQEKQQIFTRNVGRFIVFCYAAGYTIPDLHVNAEKREFWVSIFLRGQNCNFTQDIKPAVAFWKLLYFGNVYEEIMPDENLPENRFNMGVNYFRMN